ncbi:hypothetical protein FACS189472_02450 [Alphaproteobacteria bacterium]|nr:hypothetical protein FACS189472_02450 [Alphaproteobacteria bacterium]
MNKIKVIAAIGLCAAVLSPSLEAMDYEVKNGFSGMLRDVVLRLCNVMRQKPENIRNIIGMCAEYLRWKTHSCFVESRARQLTDDAIGLSRPLIPRILESTGLALQLRTRKDVVTLLQCLGEPRLWNPRNGYHTDMVTYSDLMMTNISPLVQLMFRLGKLEKPEHFLEDAAHIGMSRRAHPADTVTGAMELATFLVDHGVHSDYALLMLWTFGVTSNIPDRETLTLRLQAHGANINGYKGLDQYRGCGYTRNVLDEMYDIRDTLEAGNKKVVSKESVPTIERNIRFLVDKCRAKRFEDLRPEEQERARKEYKERKPSEDAK